MKIWTCGSSPRSGSRNALRRIKNVNGASRLSKFWNFFGAIQMISSQARLVTMDETCLYHYDPETKQQSMGWRHSRSPRSKKFRVQNFAGKVLASIFCDQDDILLIDYIPKGQTINAEYYSSLLVQLKDILKEKCHLYVYTYIYIYMYLATITDMLHTFNLSESGFSEITLLQYCL